MNNYNRNYRFDLLLFETAEEYLKRKETERKIEEKKEEEKKEKRARKSKIHKKEVMAKGICEFCDSKEMPRWVRDDEFFCCYECFYHDLDCEGSVMVPTHRVYQMRDYVSDGEWEALWEEENDIDSSLTEAKKSSIIDAFEVFDKDLGP